MRKKRTTVIVPSKKVAALKEAKDFYMMMRRLGKMKPKKKILGNKEYNCLNNNKK